MIGFGKCITVTVRCLLVKLLSSCRLQMMFIHSSLFLRSRPCRYAIMATIKAYTIIYYRVSLYYRPVNVSIMNKSPVNIYYRSIITEMVTVPASTGKPNAEKSAAVIYTSVKTYMPTPIAGMKAVISAIITPVTGCP